MRLFEALMVWRNEQAIKLSDAELHDIVLRNGRDPQVQMIRRMLTAANRDHAETIVRIMRESLGDGGPSSLTPAVPAAVDEVPSSAQPAAADPAPAAPPAGRPAPATKTAASLPGILASYEDPDGLATVVTDFVSYDYSTEGTTTPADLKVMLVGDALAFMWPALNDAGSEVLYRVATSGEGLPYSPDAFDTLLLTTGTRALDGRAAQTAVRYYTVWAYAGDSVEAATWSQPVLVASGAAVTPPQGCAIAEEGEGAVATWMVNPPTRRVDIHRFAGGQVRAFSPEHQVFGDQPNLGGFIDPELKPGIKYEYHAVAWAEVAQPDGTVGLQGSPPVILRTERRPRPRPVIDWDYEVHGSEEAPRFDLFWQPPPAGEVWFYRSEERPPSGIDTEAPLEVLERMGLGERILFPVAQEPDGRSSMRNVGWPSGWMRVYVTPVTVVGDRMHPGTPEGFVRVPAVAEPVIHQRVGFQKLAFAWPRTATGKGVAADVVHVYESAPGVPSEDAMTGRPVAEVSPDSYEQDGGVVFAGSTALRQTGSTLHLVPFAYSKGRRIPGPATRIDYPGLLQVTYEVEKSLAPFSRTRKVSFRVVSNLNLKSPPPFCLVHNPERLPLDLEDGTTLAPTPKDDPSAKPGATVVPSGLLANQPSEWWVAEAPKVGFVRLFSAVPWDKVRMVAVLDPTVRSLDLG